MAQSSKREKTKRIILTITYAVSPLIMLSLICLTARKNLFLSLPTWSDELDYWREIYSFSKNGFNFGGSLFVGFDAAVGPLGAHSFSPILVWGLFSLIFPWGAHSILIYNLLLLCVTCLFFYVIGRPKGEQVVYSLVLFILFPPLYMYIFTSMIEVPLYAGLIAFFALYMRYRGDKEKYIFVMMLVIGGWVTLVRMTYIVVLFPAVMAATDFKVNRKAIRNLLIYVAAFLASYKIYNIFCATYPDWVTVAISNASGIHGKLGVIAANTKENIVRLFSLSSSSQTAVRYAYGTVIVFFGLFSFFKLENKKLKPSFDKENFAWFVMTGGLLTMMVTLYDIKDYRDFRTFAPILFMSMLFVFMKRGEEESTVKLKRWTLGVLILLMAFTHSKELTEDCVLGTKVEVVSELAKLETKNQDNSPKILATTFDINWGDIELMKSIPSKLGFQVFYNNYVGEENYGMVDYILTTESYVVNNPSVFENMRYVTKVEGYGVLYSND